MARKVNFLGVDFNLLDDHDVEASAASGEEHTYVVMRVADQPLSHLPVTLRARMQRTLCETCRQVCRYDPKSFDKLAGVRLRIICTRCELKEPARG